MERVSLWPVIYFHSLGKYGIHTLQAAGVPDAPAVASSNPLHRFLIHLVVISLFGQCHINNNLMHFHPNWFTFQRRRRRRRTNKMGICSKFVLQKLCHHTTFIRASWCMIFGFWIIADASQFTCSVWHIITFY